MAYSSFNRGSKPNIKHVFIQAYSSKDFINLFILGGVGVLGQLLDVKQENFFNYMYRTSNNSVKNLRFHPRKRLKEYTRD